MQDQSAIFTTSSAGTLLITAAGPLKCQYHIPAFFKTMHSQRIRVGEVIGLCSLT